MSAATARKPPISTTNLNRRSQTPVDTGRSSPAGRATPVGRSTPGRASPAPATPTTARNATATTARPTARRNTLTNGRPATSSTGSPLSARGAVKTRPVTENEAELENAAVIEDLKSRLAKSETAAETAAQEYASQLTALKQRLSEANTEYMRIEEQIHTKDETIEQLEIQVKDLIRSKRDQENIYEAEVRFHHSPRFALLADTLVIIENCGSAGKGGTPG
jgi:hypothetical protein